MNFKNLIMWSVIVILVVGLFNLFQNPKQTDQNTALFEPTPNAAHIHGMPSVTNDEITRDRYEVSGRKNKGQNK